MAVRSQEQSQNHRFESGLEFIDTPIHLWEGVSPMEDMLIHFLRKVSQGLKRSEVMHRLIYRGFEHELKTILAVNAFVDRPVPLTQAGDSLELILKRYVCQLENKKRQSHTVKRFLLRGYEEECIACAKIMDKESSVPNPDSSFDISKLAGAANTNSASPNENHVKAKSQLQSKFGGIAAV